MKHADPIRIETMPMKGADRDGQLLREGTRHLIYRGPLRIGEIEETTVVHENGRDYGFHAGLTVMCLRDPERRHPTALLNKRFRTVASAVRAIKQAEQQWWESLPRTKVCGCGESKSRATRPSGEAKTPTCRFARSKGWRMHSSRHLERLPSREICRSRRLLSPSMRSASMTTCLR